MNSNESFSLADAIRAIEFYRANGRLLDVSETMDLLADYAAGIATNRGKLVLQILVEDWQVEVATA